MHAIKSRRDKGEEGRKGEGGRGECYCLLHYMYNIPNGPDKSDSVYA